MKKDFIVPIVRILLFVVGLVAVCVGYNEANQTLLYAGVVCNTLAFLLFCISRKKNN